MSNVETLTNKPDVLMGLDKKSKGDLNIINETALIQIEISGNNEIRKDTDISKSKSEVSNEKRSTTEKEIQEIVASTSHEAYSTRKASVKNTYQDKKDAVFDNKKYENKIKPLAKTNFTTVSSEQSLPPPTSLQIEENDTKNSRFISKKGNEKKATKSINSNAIQRSYSNASEKTYDKIQLPYNKDLSKTGDTKNIILTSENLFEEENFDDLNIVLHKKESTSNENLESENLIKNHDIIKGTSNEKEGVKNKIIIPGNWGIEQKVQNSEVPETVIINKALIMSTVNVSAMKIKSNGKYIETDIASKTHAIQVNFKLSKNSFNKAGNKKVYIVIENPKGKVINEKGIFSLKNGQEQPYTDQTVTYYNKTNLDLTIMSERFIQKIVKGTYIVKIYIEGELIGITLLILRGYN